MTEQYSAAPYDIAKGSGMISTEPRPIVARCSRSATAQAPSAMASWSASKIDLDSWRGWLKESLEETSDATEKLNILQGEGAPTVKQCAMDQDDTELHKGKHAVHDTIATISEHIGRLRAALRRAGMRAACAESAAERL